VVELIYRDQPVVERLDPELVHGEAEGRVGADQHLVIAFEEGRDGTDFAAIAPWVIKRRDVERQQLVERVKMCRKDPSPADPNQQTLIFQ
jgi:hypothetical protein